MGELAYLSHLLGGKQVISAKAYEQFWDWYGKSLRALRYQRHIGSLWNAGLLMGFVSREDVARALNGRAPGTFLVRFSERHAGQFAVAYVGYDAGGGGRRVKHYLVQPTDTASSKKTLPDFLSECPQFEHLLVLGKNRALEVVDKDEAFAPYLSRQERVDPGPGYESLK